MMSTGDRVRCTLGNSGDNSSARKALAVKGPRALNAPATSPGESKIRWLRMAHQGFMGNLINHDAPAAPLSSISVDVPAVLGTEALPSSAVSSPFAR